MPHKSDHLQLHGGAYRVVVAVPRDLRPIVGKKYFVQPLGTPDLNEANRLKGAWLSRFRTEIAAARRPDNELLRRARGLHRQFQAANSQQDKLAVYSDIVGTGLDLTGPLSMAAETGQAAYEKFVSVAIGYKTPLDLYLDEWIADRGFIGKTAMQHRKAFAVLGEWCKTEELEVMLQSVTKRTALSFRDTHLKLRLGSTKSINRYLSSYRTHWNWLLDRDWIGITSNPWARTHQPERRMRDHSIERDDGKRPFSSEEVRRLLAANPVALGMHGVANVLPDLMRIAALSGARIDAICHLQIRDCQEGTFKFQPQKHEAGPREVPIHSALKTLVGRRCRGKSPSDFLFHELPEQTHPAIPRSSPAVKSFTRLRRKVGIEERPNSKRQSNVDFHSWRRWFIRQAREALERGAKGFTAWTVADVVGHDPEEQPLPMTMGRYPGTSGFKARRACIEAVKLPRIRTRHSTIGAEVL